MGEKSTCYDLIDGKTSQISSQIVFNSLKSFKLNSKNPIVTEVIRI